MHRRALFLSGRHLESNVVACTGKQGMRKGRKGKGADHETGDEPMKWAIIVLPLPREHQEVIARLRSLIAKELHVQTASHVCHDADIRPFLRSVLFFSLPYELDIIEHELFLVEERDVGVGEWGDGRGG